MRVVDYREGKQIPSSGSVVALGLFDGVHIAHRELIARAVELARERGLSSAVFTFPSESRALKRGRARLYSTKQRLDLISRLGVDICAVADFDSISAFSPEKFVRDCLIRDMNAELTVAGFNFRFGKGAEAGAAELISLMRAHGKGGETRAEVTFDGAPLSTSLVREYLETRRIEEAWSMLGVPFYIEGRVERGLHLGTDMGTPTLNLPLPAETLAPPRGVYRCAVLVGGMLYPAVTNIGVCPTLGERGAHAEAHLIGLDKPLYGEQIKIFFLGYLRDEIKFPSKKELIMQINIDKKAALPREGEAIWTDSGLSLP